MDLFHAREHLHDLARRLEFMLGDRKDDWLAARLEDLDHGDIDGICNAARAAKKVQQPHQTTSTLSGRHKPLICINDLHGGLSETLQRKLSRISI